MNSGIEGNDERDVPVRAENAIEEGICAPALALDNGKLAFAGVDEQTDREGQIGFLREVTDFGRGTRVSEFEIVFAEVGDEFAVRVPNAG